MHPLKITLSCLSALILAGCLGSSSDDSGPRSMELVPVLMDDNSTITVTPADSRVIDAGGITAVTNSDVVEARFENNQVILTAPDHDRPQQAVVSLRNGDGDTLSFFEVLINNVAGQAAEEETQVWIAQRVSIQSLSEDVALLRLISAVGYLTGELTATEQDSLNNLSVTTTSSHNALAQAITDAESTLVQYRGSQVGQGALENALQGIRNTIGAHQQITQDRLEQAVAMTTTFDKPTMTLSYDAENRVVSSLIGNESVGEQTQSGWLFDLNQTHLELAATNDVLAACHGSTL